jgi:Raf kinase inhibitor-like YbhB/YbcL family protein
MRDRFLTTIIISGILALPGACQTDKIIALNLPRLRASRRIAVSSRTLRSGEPISKIYSGYDENRTPDIRWTILPDKIRSFALLVEDPDAPGAAPFVHWIAYGIPRGVQSLPLKRGGIRIEEGINGSGSTGYYGPHPPKGDPPHHYHFEVFALDTFPALPAGANRDALVAAMAHHVVASGQFIATYQEK